MKSVSHVSLERPRFGAFARQIAEISAEDLESTLQRQRSGEGKGRIGELLVERGLLAPEDVYVVLDRMAKWVVSTRQADMPGFGFPAPITLSVCMPCYNEADIITDCLQAACTILPHFVEDFEIVAVDDGSRDQTGDLIREASERDSRVRLVRHPQNRGYGAAVTTAMKAAACDYVMFTDGDGQFSMLDVPQLLSSLGHADYVVGYRYQRAEGGMRRINAKAWGKLIQFLLGVTVRDLDCAFKIFPRSVVQQLQMTSDGACINAEIMAQLVRSDLRHVEVPVMHYPRYAGAATGANLKVIAKAFRELPQLMKYRSAKPIQAPRDAMRLHPTKTTDREQRPAHTP